MDDLEEPEIRPYYRCYNRGRETNPFFLAVLRNDLAHVRRLVESGKSVNTKNKLGYTLLNYVIVHQRFEIFDYLLSLEVDVDWRDGFGRSPLLCSVDEYFTSELIRKGADIHVASDDGFTFLHMAARCKLDTLKVGRLVIEKGADVDARARFGITPLYTACEEENFDWIYMLLYFGADATIPSDNGILPIAILSEHSHLEEILFNHTFDGDGIEVKLSTVVAAMGLDASLFSKIVDISKIEYDLSDLEYFYSGLIHVKAKHFRVFIQKFGHIVKEMIENFAPLTMLVRLGLDLELPQLKETFYVFLESDYVSEFVQTSDPSYPTISRLVQMFNKPEMFLGEEEITKIVCQMLSYGLSVTSDDLDTVYVYYRNCELFKILLHMDIVMVNSGKNDNVAALLYYDPTTEIDVFLNEFSISADLLNFYNHHKLKELCLKGPINDEIAAKIKNLPSVPSLVELSRNVARKYILNRYHVQNSKQFYTILRWLPIGEMTKNIIALETKLYP